VGMKVLEANATCSGSSPVADFGVTDVRSYATTFLVVDTSTIHSSRSKPEFISALCRSSKCC
jgi:hypothetical protein